MLMLEQLQEQQALLLWCWSTHLWLLGGKRAGKTLIFFEYILTPTCPIFCLRRALRWQRPPAALRRASDGPPPPPRWRATPRTSPPARLGWPLYAPCRRPKYNLGKLSTSSRNGWHTWYTLICNPEPYPNQPINVGINPFVSCTECLNPFIDHLVSVDACLCNWESVFGDKILGISIGWVLGLKSRG